MHDILKNKKWTKNWSGNWSLLFASLYGDIYTKGLRDIVGKNIENFVITFENGVSSNYLIPEEIENLSRVFVGYIKKDSHLGEKWANHVIQKSEEILSFISNLDENNLIIDDYKRLCFLCSSVTPENFAIKKIIDYLTADLLDKYFEIFSKARKATEPIYNEIDRILVKILEQSVGDKLSKEERFVLTQSEFENYISTKQLPDVDILRKRYLGCIILYDKNGNGRILTEKDFTEFIESITKRQNINNIKGTPAFKGLVKGTVRIVLDPMNPGIFEDGDILVAGMTRPEYLQLMKKSGGFVTDAGGLLSHAAIVARELKKPCIIGTEVATKVLKNGDVVEVDANTGIIKRI